MLFVHFVLGQPTIRGVNPEIPHSSPVSALHTFGHQQPTAINVKVHQLNISGSQNKISVGPSCVTKGTPVSGSGTKGISQIILNFRYNV